MQWAGLQWRGPRCEAPPSCHLSATPGFPCGRAPSAAAPRPGRHSRAGAQTRARPRLPRRSARPAPRPAAMGVLKALGGLFRNVKKPWEVGGARRGRRAGWGARGAPARRGAAGAGGAAAAAGARAHAAPWGLRSPCGGCPAPPWTAWAAPAPPAAPTARRAACAARRAHARCSNRARRAPPAPRPPPLPTPRPPRPFNASLREFAASAEMVL
jgi:hypothetical protein